MSENKERSEVSDHENLKKQSYFRKRPKQKNDQTERFLFKTKKKLIKIHNSTDYSTWMSGHDENEYVYWMKMSFLDK